MFSLQRWKENKVKAQFKALGEDCRFSGRLPDIKGRVRVGKRCTVQGNVVFRTRKKGLISLADEIFVGDYSLFQANEAITIARGAYIGPYTILRDTNHLMKGTEIHWRLTPHLTAPIVLEEDCYIGARCYIMPGVRIGVGAVIGPGSIVTKEVPDQEIWAGSPAHFIAHRSDASRRSKLKRDLGLVAMFGLDDEAPVAD